MVLNVTDLHIAFNKWEKASEQTAHGENEYERERHQAVADKLAEPWRSQYPEDWQYLGQLREQWRTDPDGLREEITKASQAWWNHPPTADDDNLDRRKLRHMSYTQYFYDPLEQEKRDWQDRCVRRAELSGELAAARDDTEADAIEARIAEFDDTTEWPASWHALEEEARTDPQSWYEQSERASEHYTQIIQAREAAAAVNSGSIGQGQEETETAAVAEVELEESSWGA